jgi:phenylalanyl-tRNA synthetase beta chain
MIITRKWLQEYVDISKISTYTICKALNSIGLEVDSTHRFLIPNGVVIGKVESCEKHLDADKLNVCQVNIGTKTEQIVCGAKNVAAGQYVPVATVGAVLGEDFKIKKAKLRGVASNGMICSSTEIGLPAINDGILELDDSIGELLIGKELNEYSLINDETIEIELTANRGDCLSIHGVAREIATYFNIPMKNFDPEVVTNNMGVGQIFDIDYDTSCESHLIYKAVNIENLKLPVLYKIRTATVEQLKENDIQTIIAYTTHATGVLLNAYSKNVASKTENGDIVTLAIKPDNNGFDTVTGEILLSTIGIDAGTFEKISDEIIIEASYINPDKLAQKVFDNKKQTGEVYYRASRGSEPNLEFGIDTAITLFSQNGATIFNGSKNFINDVEPHTLTVNMEHINKIIGQEIEVTKVIQILTTLGFFVKQNAQDSMSITVPEFRHDICNVADITEEIVRIIGIDQIKSKPLLIQELNNINPTSNALVVKNQIRTKAIANGFFETITYLFTNKEQLEKYNFPTVYKKYDILNPIVNELNTFRTTLAMNLIQAVSHNVKLGFKKIALFESGIIFDKSRNEIKQIGFVFSGESENPAVSNGAKPKNIDLFTFAGKISNIIGKFELEPIKKITNDFIHPYQNGTIIYKGKNIGCIYKLHPLVAEDFDISPDTFICEISEEELKNETIFASNISKFQSSRRDLSVVTPKSLEYKEIRKVITSLGISEIKQFNLVDIYSDEALGDNESLTISFVLQSEEKTFTEDEISEIMNTILEKLQSSLGLELR